MARTYRSSTLGFFTFSTLTALLLCQSYVRADDTNSVRWSEWSDWSACSAQCDSGVSTRSRKCREGVRVSSTGTFRCNNTDTQIKVCLIKACPPDEPSPRQAACSQYDHRVFSGRQYVWEPFVHPTDPCKLSCRAKGEHFYANLADRVEDGASCGNGTSTAVCINGVCKSLGCDGIVESTTVKDKCGVCQGDDSTCKTISGIFTSTGLKRGLNYVITIPMGSTNINITELRSSRNLLLLQTSAGKTFINGGTSSPTSGDIMAAGTVFTYGAKSSSHPRESIYSPGPTNITVILKLLLRGSNPGIMYTFNVPGEDGDRVLQQITHHSRPVELPPDSASSLQSSQRKPLTHHQRTKPRRTEHVDMNPLGEPFSGHDHKVNKEPTEDPDLRMGGLTFDSAGEQDQASETEGLSNDFDTLKSTSHIYTRDRVLSPPGNEKERELSDRSREKIIRASHAVAENLNLDSSFSSSRANPDSFDNSEYVNSLTRSQNNSNTQVREYDFEDSLEDDLDDSEEENESRNYNDPESGDNDHDKNEDYRRGKDVSFQTNDDRIQEVLNDHRIKYDDGGLYPSEDYVLEKPRQSVAIPLNSVVDPNEIEDWSSDSSNEESDSLETGNSGSSESISAEESSSIEVGGDENEREKTFSRNRNTDKDRHNSAQVKTDHVDISLEYTDHASTIKPNNGNVQKSNPTNQAQSDSSENDNIALRGNHQRYPFAIPSGSKYRIPKYSQSFTFAERYKDIYNRRSSRRDPPRSRLRPNRNHHHRNHDQISREVDTNLSPELTPSYPRTISNRRRPVNYDETHFEETNTEHVRNNGRGDSISAFGSVLRTSSSEESYQGASDSQQNDWRSHAARQKRLRDRQALADQRRRRLQEQRNRYNERLREYQERLKQRRAEIESKRRQDRINSSGVKTDSARSWERERNQDTHRLVQTRAPPTLTQRTRPSYVQSERHSSWRGSNERSYKHPNRNRNDYTRNGNEGRNLVPGYYPSGEILDSQEKTTLRPYLRASLESPDRNDNVFVRIHSSSRNQDDIDNEREPPYFSHTTAPSPEKFTDSQYQSKQQDNYDYDRVRQRPPTSDRQHNRGLDPGFSNEDAPVGQSLNEVPNENQVPFNPTRNVDLSTSEYVEGNDVIPNQIPLNTLTTGHVPGNSVYEWRISGLTECTRTCGGGVQQTVVVCVDTRTQAVVTDENCGLIEKPKQLAVKCNKRPCPVRWAAGPWSSCSATCGPGKQTRSVSCQARVSPTLNLTMPDASCEGKVRMPNTQACSNNPCSSWRVGNWTECSARCGDGKKTRDVHCIDLEDNIVSDDECTELEPDREEQCNLGECGQGWFFTRWPEECKAECGTGEVTRKIFCSSDSGQALPESRCDQDQRPAVTQSCRVERPCGGMWFTGEWSKCAVLCGEGERSRDVQCIKALAGGVFAVVEEENCDPSIKPLVTEKCNKPACVPEWYMTSWSQCSQSCGTGYRTREVKCLDPSQNPSDKCTLHRRPKTRNACNTHQCSADNSAEVEEDPGCQDKFAQCRVVKRARLCRYGYYKKMCCKSCSKES